MRPLFDPEAFRIRDVLEGVYPVIELEVCLMGAMNDQAGAADLLQR